MYFYITLLCWWDYEIIVFLKRNMVIYIKFVFFNLIVFLEFKDNIGYLDMYLYVNNLVKGYL